MRMQMDGFLQVHYTSLIQYDKDFINHIYVGPILVDSELTFLILAESCFLLSNEISNEDRWKVMRHSFIPPSIYVSKWDTVVHHNFLKRL